MKILSQDLLYPSLVHLLLSPLHTLPPLPSLSAPPPPPPPPSPIYPPPLLSLPHHSIGHNMVPIQLPPVVLPLVKLLTVWNEIFQLRNSNDVMITSHHPISATPTSVGKETGTLSELLDHAPALSTLILTISILSRRGQTVQNCSCPHRAICLSRLSALYFRDVTS